MRMPFLLLSTLLVAIVVISTSSKAEDAKPKFWVKSAGEMRDVMQKGNLDSHMDTATLRETKHLYALGPVEGLKGEITIVDGKPWIATIHEAKPHVSESWPKACFLVYAQVPAWRKFAIPKEFDTLEKLELHIRDAAKKAGVDIEKPFPFLVTGSRSVLKYHLIWKTDGLPHTKELHQKAKLEFEVKDREVKMIGFYSNQHHGVFTHHDSNVHVHFHTIDDKDAGHVEALKLDGGMVLFLPE